MSSTSTLLFFNMLHNPGPCERLVDELDRELPPLPEVDARPYSITGLENQLPYLSACIKENFRLTPIFGMPLPRRVDVPGGMEIAGNISPRV
jgi:cytochrome P450